MATDLFGEESLEDLERVPGRKVPGTVREVLTTRGPDDFQTVWQAALKLGFTGAAGDLHAGHTRRSGSREPWYPRGSEMCNERQLSLVSVEELALIAARMGIERIEAGWIGANVLIEGIARFTLLPPRTRLVFAGGAVVRVDGDNAPCRAAGKAIAGHLPEHEGLELAFPRHGRRRRGLVGFVERPGVIRPGEEVVAHVPEHWLYR
ncbi:MOSC domain-containing protein [Stappia sp.]|jgi:hypothetical protein|uniref:MOSC domain-containing protein n=1 Tax=Stappia sp. TaxID=1870903 RepID=UPI003A9A3898